MIEFIALGGAKEIAANSYYIKWNKTHIILDCGMDLKSQGYKRIPRLELIEKEPDLIFISHSHLDHIGSLPVLAEIYRKSRIVMAKGNEEIANVMLADSSKILERYDEHNRRFYSKYFRMSVLGKLMQRMEFLPYDKEFLIGENIRAKLFSVGHIRGASGIFITDENKSVVYTGDYSISADIALPPLAVPKGKIDVLISECTNGESDYTEEARIDNRMQLIDEINITLQEGGSVLLPSFALGKSQELLSYLSESYVKLTTKPSIYAIGMSNKITPYYGYDINIDVISRIGNRIPKNSIIVATNGMMIQRTPSYQFASTMISNPLNKIIFTGYLDPESFGFYLLHSPKGSLISFDEGKIIKNAEVMMFSLSLHASSNAIISTIKQSKALNTILVHGSPSALKGINSRNDNKSIIPEIGESLLLSGKTVTRRKSMDNYIVTVGTSSFASYVKKNNKEPKTYNELLDYVNSGDERKISSEINTIEGMKADIGRNTCFYFIASDTKEGKLCAEMLEQYYVNRNAGGQVVLIEELNRDSVNFQTRGLINFIKKISKIIIETDRRVKILATGGFKAEIAYANVLGLLFKLEVVYMHEDFKRVITMPQLPVTFDMTEFELFFNDIMAIPDTPDYKEASRMIRNLPEKYKAFFNKDKGMKRYVLSPIGTAYIDYYRSGFWRRDSIANKIESTDTHKTLWGKSVKSFDDITDKEINIILKRIYKIGKSLIDNMELKEMKASKTNIEPHLEFEKLVRNDTASYWIHTNQGSQRLHIKTKKGTNDMVVELIGKKIYE